MRLAADESYRRPAARHGLSNTALQALRVWRRTICTNGSGMWHTVDIRQTVVLVGVVHGRLPTACLVFSPHCRAASALREMQVAKTQEWSLLGFNSRLCDM